MQNMKISVNNKETEITPETSVYELAISLRLPDKGVAIAVNNRMVPRTAWETTGLQENDSLVIIQAACGG